MHKIIAVITLLFALFVVNWSIYIKEKLLSEGNVVFLKLAPVDPRSLMQGDYMSLRFEMADQIRATLTQRLQLKSNTSSNKSFDGLVEVELDDKSIASFLNITNAESIKQTASNQRTINQSTANQVIALKFRLRNSQIKLATNAYFFEEGAGNKLAQAKYGEFRVAINGELLLVALCDENLKKLG